MDRIIGKHVGEERGPLLVCLGAMHGNEPAGVRAIDLMMKMLEVEPITNPDFKFKGAVIGLIGNVQAFKEQKRFIERDLNRMFTQDIISKVLSSNKNDLKNEYLELRETIELIRDQIKEINPTRMVVMDLHTTSSKGGIFSISTDDQESVAIALELHAPVIKGFLNEVKGTSLHYFNSENFDVPTVPVTFESGQHKEELSINRAIAAITNCMRSLGCVEAEHVENRHDHILEDYSRHLPKIVELVKRHEIRENDSFKMEPDFRNFQVINKGELLAFDKNGEILAPSGGRLLMPLYQSQGEDGFFIVKVIEGY